MVCFTSVSSKHSSEPITHIIKMEGMMFVPLTIEIKPGEKVCWVNDSNLPHNVCAKDKTFNVLLF